jgi:hypothetical protein
MREPFIVQCAMFCVQQQGVCTVTSFYHFDYKPLNCEYFECYMLPLHSVVLRPARPRCAGPAAAAAAVCVCVCVCVSLLVVCWSAGGCADARHRPRAPARTLRPQQRGVPTAHQRNV